MKFFKLFFLSQIILFNCIGFGTMLNIVSTNEGNGKFTYKVSAGTEPYYFGGKTDLLKIVLPSENVIETYNPEGWSSTVDVDNTVTWICTNSAITFIDSNEFIFSLISDNIEQTNYNNSFGEFYSKGFVQGEVYSNDYSLYYLKSGSGNKVASANIAGYETFAFIGPVVPEPFLFINCYLLFIIYYRRKFKSTF